MVASEVQPVDTTDIGILRAGGAREPPENLRRISTGPTGTSNQTQHQTHQFRRQHNDVNNETNRGRATTNSISNRRTAPPASSTGAPPLPATNAREVGRPGGTRAAGRRPNSTDNDDDDDLGHRHQRHRPNPEKCCNCSRHATCSKNTRVTPNGRHTGCSCFTAGRPCVNCDCYQTVCRNKHTPPAPRRGPIHNFFGMGGNGDRAAVATGAGAEEDRIALGGAHEILGGGAQNHADNAEDNDAGNGPPAAEENQGGQPPNDAPNHPAIFANGCLAPDDGADRADYVVTEADHLLDSVYGDHAHKNAGTHLNGGILDDARWQRLWKRVVSIPPNRYRVPQGPVGRQFLATLAREFQGIRTRLWNSERPLVFVAVVLQRAHGVTKAKEIKALLQAKLKMWDEGQHCALVNDLETEARLRAGFTRPKADEEQQFRAFNKRVLSGHLRPACRTLTGRNGGGIMQPDDLCSKSGRPVYEVLLSKHPDLRDPPIGPETGVFEDYPAVPEAVPVVVGADVVERVASKLTGGAGPGGTDAIDLRNWLLRYKNSSAVLRGEMAALATWMASSNPPWAATRALLACRLVALDKQPGTRPVGIGETYRRLIAKCVIDVTGQHATQACGNFNLCAGLKGGIEGAVHAVRAEWNDPANHDNPPGIGANPPGIGEIPPGIGENPPGNGTGAPPPGAPPPRNPTEDPNDYDESNDDDPYGVTCVDARNGFNELSRKAMLWTVRHRWPKGARFAFNCYRHACTLIVRRDGEECSTILSREGVTQGDPLAMILYGVALVPLAEVLRAEVPSVIQPWYADDCAMAGKASGIATAMRLLLRLGPARGYFPEPEKSIFIGKPEQEAMAKEALSEFNFRHMDGARYIGSFIGSEDSQKAWLQPRIDAWKENIGVFAKVARKYPQTAYAGLIKSLQTEWTYLQRVIPDVAAFFQPIEDAIKEEFLPALLGAPGEVTEDFRALSCLPVRFAGLGIPNPVHQADRQYQTSVEMTAAVSTSLRSGTNLDATGYGASSTKLSRAKKKAQEGVLAATLAQVIAAAPPAAARKMARAQHTGAWLTPTPDTVNATGLTKEEFRDNLRIRFGFKPLNLPHTCDGCHQRFTVGHAMQCKMGGLIGHRHNDVAATWSDLCASALTPASVTDEPLIPHDQDGPAQVRGPDGDPPLARRGDIGAYGFWRRGTTAIFDVRITDTDAASWRHMSTAKVLRRHEKEKKDKYGDLCRNAHLDFTPLVFSVDGMEGTEATAARKHLAARLAGKWNLQYSQMCGFVKARLSLALARATSRCLRGTRDQHYRPHSMLWVAGTGQRLYR